MMRALAALALLAAALLAWHVDRRVLLACYLAAWWFWTGTAMGGLANVWLHTLSGGAWGEPLRAPLLRCGRAVPAACLLFLPVLAGMHILYPWATQGVGVLGLAAPQFKALWLSPGFFIGRSLAYLACWSLLARLSQRPALQGSRGFCAAALVAYTFTVGLAATDWLMSLLPQWYSSVYGWLAGSGQMLAGMALAIVWVTRLPGERKVLPDLGNLLMMYVMTWAYLAFVQFLIIWAENLPHEIVWYLRRGTPGWVAVAWLLVVFHGALPMAVLLSRKAKRSAAWMRALGLGMLAAHLLDCWWQVLPSLDGVSLHWLWMAPLTAAVLGLAGSVLVGAAPAPAASGEAYA